VAPRSVISGKPTTADAFRVFACLYLDADDGPARVHGDEPATSVTASPNLALRLTDQHVYERSGLTPLSV
jgi:hypothetical protein